MVENHISAGRALHTSQAEDVISQISERARNLFETRQMLCTEAVVVALKNGLDSGLTENQAISMAAPFCMGLGESGCVCGALSGAVMVNGLFLERDHPLRSHQISVWPVSAAFGH